MRFVPENPVNQIRQEMINWPKVVQADFMTEQGVEAKSPWALVTPQVTTYWLFIVVGAMY